MDNMKYDPIDEMKIVQDIITTQEELCFKVMSWAIGLITALTVGLFHKSVDLNAVIYLIAGTTTVCGFFLVAKYHWTTFHQAIERSKEIEKEIKSDTYKYIKINEILRTKSELGTFADPRLYIPYLTLLIVVVISAISSICS